MVKKVVPLSKVQLTSLEVALQNFDTSVGARVLVFEDSVVFCSWYFDLVNFDFIYVQRGSILNMYRDVLRDLLPERGI